MASTSGTHVDDPEVRRIRTELIRFITGSSWNDVVEVYRQDPRAHKIEISQSGDTALHIAVESGQEDTVKQLVELITERSKDAAVDVLSAKNEKKNTPLHLAASLGSIPMCKCITGKYKELVGFRNVIDETPLFTAAGHGEKKAFLLLYEMCDKAQVHEYCRQNSSRHTVLSYAIRGGHFDLAFQIIHMEDLMDSFDENGSGRSSLLALADNPTAFRSSIYFSLFEKIIYDCIFVEELIPKISKEREKLESPQHPNNYQTCTNFFQVTWKMIKLPGKNSKPLDAENPTEGQDHHCSSNGAPGPQQPPLNYCRCLSPIKLIISKALLLILSGIPAGSSEIRKLKEKKERHIWSLQIMNNLVERAARYERKMNPAANNQGNQNFLSEYEYFAKGIVRSTPILIAAMNGIVEMVEKILQNFPMTIHDRDGKKKNIVLLAVEKRQSHLYDFLLKSPRLLDKDLAIQAVDRDKNNALHLAAKLKNYESWFIPSSSMLQMQWEVKWYEYVKNSLTKDSTLHNSDRKTPEQIFTETHRELLEKSKEWLNSTCNSCSFIAALIATVAFASSATVPGGVNQDTGKPIFLHHLAFRFFAISALVALCSSFISLLIFCALLISKCQYKDFSKNVPRNLLFGLTFLFISMAAMLLCFISGHFLMLDNQLKYYAAVPVYAVTFLVITFLSCQQLPSYVALMRATFQKVPQRIYKEGTL